MEIENCGKVPVDPYKNKEYEIQMKTLKQALDHEFELER